MQAQAGDYVLLISTGFFGDRFVDCFEAYGVHVTVLRPAELGGRPTPEVRAWPAGLPPFACLRVTEAWSSCAGH